MAYVALMLCRIFGKKIPTHFPTAWVSLLVEVAKVYSLNWSKILSDNLAKDITKYQTEKSKG
jgi:hypothetical protein